MACKEIEGEEVYSLLHSFTPRIVVPPTKPPEGTPVPKPNGERWGGEEEAGRKPEQGRRGGVGADGGRAPHPPALPGRLRRGAAVWP